MAIEMIQKRYPDLFQVAQAHYGIGSSKVFVDAVPKRLPSDIMRDYKREHTQSGFELQPFIERNFTLPTATQKTQLGHGQQSQSIRDYIELMWSLLERSDQPQHDHSSLLGLPKPYIVPGGRFREIYYWDSYFTMLGLAHAKRPQMVRYMVQNFAYLIDLVGFIPNGNRSYYCTRSQPPFFAMMIELLGDIENDRSAVLLEFLPQLRKEYDFWMRGHSALDNAGDANARVIRVEGGYLNRYWDDSDLPRPEGYMEDIELATHSARDAAEVYRDIRAAAESGWDFSGRWFADYASLNTIRTTDIIPVDLNCLMHRLESVLAEAYGYANQTSEQQRFERRATQRQHLITTLFFDHQLGFFCDLTRQDLTTTPVLSLAGVFPLYFGLATPTQAAAVDNVLGGQFLSIGGWVNTLLETRQQWDSPNGWAPLQWMTYSGLMNYGFSDSAKQGAQCWVDNNLQVFEQHGVLYEKYNVNTIAKVAEGGEYDVQHGFGWTNAVLLVLMDELGLD